jgi:hypothetical protein
MVASKGCLDEDFSRSLPCYRCPISTKTGKCQHISTKKSPISNLMKIRSAILELLDATDWI